MANIKSAKKRAVTNKKRNIKNNARKSAIKTITKKIMTALAHNDIETAKSLQSEAVAKINRAKGKNVFHKNTAARKISTIMKRIAHAQS